MNKHSFDGTQGAASLLTQARQESIASGDLVRAVLGGTRRIDSWLIENRILPALQQRDIRTLHFALTTRGVGKRSAALVPLAEGEAFACSTSSRWSALSKLEAISAIQYIGLRYAPGNRWLRGFEATVQRFGELPQAVRPFDVASLWEEATGSRPAGFADGTLDEMEAMGMKLIGRIFNTQGRLGL